ncbi:MFS general substrate transporter [Venustampulla echinocandica]|uniref:MFS general substrate transporter n=1 Tax=Venustampulla echinocandica TaxID=2656787 RepID=A0A370TM03_9HELO|nr:MFS general substrate transporter [Venustampulla echinocandica]RDL36552.1 MFS general substrate transporter [Venustampulla echinocandica]
MENKDIERCTARDVEGQTTTQKRSWRFYGTFACLALLNFICAIDATILSVALPTIATDLKGTTAIQAFWCGTSFLLTSTVFQPSWASFSHIIGRRSVLLTALVLFTVGTIIASAAKHIAYLLMGRCVQGIGGGGLVSLTYVVVSDMVTLRERGKWFSVISLQWAIGSVVGPVIGGAFAEKTTWRWIFWLNLPFCAIAALGIPICLRLNSLGGSAWTRLRKFDWLGSFIFVAAATSFLIPLTWGGVMYSWSSWRTLVPLVLGLVGLASFIVYSIYVSSEPLIRRTLFNTPTAVVAYIGTVLHGIIVWSILYYMPLYFEVVKNYSAITSGVALFPFTFTICPAAIVVGIVITKTGRYRPSIWIGWFLTTLGMGLLIILKESTSTACFVFLSLVGGFGTGMLFSAQGFAAQATVSNPDLPFAGAMYSFFRAFGQTLGVAASGAIFQNAFKESILTTGYSEYAEDWSRDASSFVQVVKSWSSHEEHAPMKAVAVAAYIKSLQMVWAVMCVLAAIALGCSLLWIDEISLERELETDQGFINRPKKISLESKEERTSSSSHRKG